MRKVALLIALVVALAGCTSLANLGDLRKDIEAAGYDVSGLSHNTTNGHAVLRVQATTEGAGDGGAERIAEVVWTKYPAEVDELVVVLDGEQALDLSADELVEKFGERPAELGDAARTSSGPNVTVIVVSVVAALLLAGLVVLVWLRGRRPPPPMAPPGSTYPPPPYPAPPRHPG